MTRAVAGKHAGGNLKVGGQVHPDQVRSKIEHQGGVELAPLYGGGTLEQRAEIETEDVHHLYRCLIGPDRAERFQVGFTRLGGQNQEFRDACPVLPGLDKFIHHTVKRAPPEGSAPGEGPRRGMDAVLDYRGAGDGVRR
jgi:hypothetical protein